MQYKGSLDNHCFPTQPQSTITSRFPTRTLLSNMIRSLYTIALLGGIAAALPAPSPAVTPPAVLSRRQDEGPNAEGCTITSESETSFENTVLEPDDSGGIITSTQTYTISAQLGCNCNDGVIAGVSVSYSRHGTKGHDGIAD